MKMLCGSGEALGYAFAAFSTGADFSTGSGFDFI
jgi:hypothetical protein